MGDMVVERIGGIAGFGLPGSRLKSRGRCKFEALPATDQARVNALFDATRGPGKPGMPDVFRYRVTRQTPKGDETIEVPETDLPTSVISCVKDELD
jgi:hypothetical protein